MTALQMVGVHFSYGQNHVLQGVDLTLAPGEIGVLVGANGAGKSTLLSIVAGLLQPTKGTVTWKGDAKFDVGYVPQAETLFEELNVVDNIGLWTKLAVPAIQKRLRTGFLQTLGLDGILKQRVSTLSGGMKRRVDLACALIDEPKILVMDEPYTSLDVIYQKELSTLLQAYADRGGAVLLSTHEQAGYDMAEIAFVLDHGVVKRIQPKPEFAEITQWIS